MAWQGLHTDRGQLQEAGFIPEFSQQRTGWTLARANALCRAKTRLAVSLLACSYEAQTGKAFTVIF